MRLSLSALSISAGVLAFTLVFGNPLAAQSLLERAEQQLPAAGAAGAATPAPGSGYLGAVLDDEGQMNRGVLVKEVRAGGPSELGGLKAGDMITAIDAKAVTRMDDLDAVLGKAIPGQRLRLLVVREGQQQSLNILLGTRPSAPAGPAIPAPESPSAPVEPAPALTSPGPSAPAASLPGGAAPGPGSDPLLAPPSASSPLNLPASPAPPASSAPPLVIPENSAASPPAESPAPIRSRPSSPSLSTPSLEPGGSAGGTQAGESLPSPGSSGSGASLGVSVLPLTDEARAAHGLTVRRGAYIAAVKPGSPADQAGLPVGAVIVALNGRRIDSADDLVAFISTAQPGQEVELAYYEGARLNRKNVRLGAPIASGGAATIAPPGRSGPLGLGGGGTGRPLLDRVERMVEGLSPVRAPSTIYNPAEMAELHARIVELGEQVRGMEERLRALEGRGGGSSGAPAGSSPTTGGSFAPGGSSSPFSPPTSP